VFSEHKRVRAYNIKKENFTIGLCPKDESVCSYEKPVNTNTLQSVINQKSTIWICAVLKTWNLHIKTAMNVTLQRYEAKEYKESKWRDA
jgi:hypothetical protein